MKNTTEKLTLREAVQLLGVDCDTSKRQVNIECPVCSNGSRKTKKLNINFDKFGPDDGVFRCNKCGTSGRALHFWGLYRGIDDPKDAAKDYYKFISNETNSNAVKRVKSPPPPKPVECPLAPLTQRDKAYKAFLKRLALSEKHMNMLKERGFSEDEIIHNGYKTFPLINKGRITRSMLNEGIVIEGVPGFYQEANGNWTFSGKMPGILVPQRNGFGQIQSFQIRYDENISGCRYAYFSSRDKMRGAGAEVFCHISIGNSIEEVVLTEGALKADAITSFTGKTVLSIPGVNCVKYLPKALTDLKKKGLKTVHIAFDMDVYCNPYVEEALKNLKKILSELQIQFYTLNWDLEEKGLDDYLKKQIKKTR